MMRKIKSQVVTFLIALFFLPTTSFAQAVKLANQSSTIVDLILKIVGWGLLFLILAGIVMMPIAGVSWYKRNRADHKWIDYFKSGNFAIRITVIILAFILWIFKIVDYIAHKFL